MRRRALNIAALSSLILFLGVAAAKLAVGKRPILRELDGRGQRWELLVTDQAITLRNDPQLRLERTSYAAMMARLHPPEWYGVHFSTLLELTLLLPAVWGVVAWRDRRARARRWNGHCRGCGYDVRSSPYRCPECGKPVSTWSG
jgi:hypothetical protein